MPGVGSHWRAIAGLTVGTRFMRQLLEAVVCSRSTSLAGLTAGSQKKEPNKVDLNLSPRDGWGAAPHPSRGDKLKHNFGSCCVGSCFGRQSRAQGGDCAVTCARAIDHQAVFTKFNQALSDCTLQSTVNRILLSHNRPCCGNHHVLLTSDSRPQSLLLNWVSVL